MKTCARDEETAHFPAAKRKVLLSGLNNHCICEVHGVCTVPDRPTCWIAYHCGPVKLNESLEVI